MLSQPIFSTAINYEDLRERGVDHRLLTLLWLYRSGRKNAAKELFTNKIHFEVFKHLKNNPTHIYCSNRYLVLQFTQEVKIRRDKKKTAITNYVIGINTDNKLFINRMTNFVYNEVDRINSYVYYVSDQCVHYSLGYDYDLETDGSKTIPIADQKVASIKTYRVQGDLVFTVYLYDVPLARVYRARIAESIHEQIVRALSNLILRRIQKALSEIGISSELHGNVLSILAIPKSRQFNLSYQFMETLAKIILKTTDLSDISNKIAVARDFPTRNPDLDIEITVAEGRWEFGSPYIPLEVTIWFNPDFRDAIADQIVRSLKIEAKERSVTFSRHKITYIGYPTRFNFIYEYPYLDENNERFKTLFEVDVRALFVTEGEIKIQHVEHGVMKYTVAKPIEIGVENTHINRFFDARLNYYTFKLLQKKQLPLN